MLHRGQVRERFAQKYFRSPDLRCRHFDFAKRMASQPIYELTGLDFGASFVVVPDFASSSRHTSTPTARGTRR
jgi:hypothetical protein